MILQTPDELLKVIETYTYPPPQQILLLIPPPLRLGWSKHGYLNGLHRKHVWGYKGTSTESFAIQSVHGSRREQMNKGDVDDTRGYRK